MAVVPSCIARFDNTFIPAYRYCGEGWADARRHIGHATNNKNSFDSHKEAVQGICYSLLFI